MISGQEPLGQTLGRRQEPLGQTLGRQIYVVKRKRSAACLSETSLCVGVPVCMPACLTEFMPVCSHACLACAVSAL